MNLQEAIRIEVDRYVDAVERMSFWHANLVYAPDLAPQRRAQWKQRARRHFLTIQRLRHWE